MKESAIQKINQMGKAGAVLALIMKILLGIGLGACVIGLIATLLLPADMVQVDMTGVADITLDLSRFGENIFAEDPDEEILEDVKDSTKIQYAGNQMYVSEVKAEGSRMMMTAGGDLTTFNLRSCTWALAGAIVMLVVLFVSVVFAGRLAKAFRDCRTPFEGKVIRTMKQFAYSLLPWSVISGIVCHLESRIWISGVSGWNISIDVTTIVISLVILALAYIFQYGAVLQQESDETI